MKAFPFDKKNYQGQILDQQQGMDLRDYFAAKAMQGMLSDTAFDAAPERAAELAYIMADAMMEARKL